MAPDPFNEQLQSMSDEETAEWSCRALIRSLLRPRDDETPETQAALDYARRTLEAGAEGMMGRAAALDDEDERIDAYGDIEFLVEGVLLISAGVPEPEVEKLLRRRSGRPPTADPGAVRSMVLRLMDHHGDFAVGDPEWGAQARLEEAIEVAFGVSKSRARVLIGRPLEEWRRLKSGL